MGSKAPKAAKLPTAAELAPLVDLQAQYNRVGYETPFGAQNYITNPDGTFTLKTDIGPEGRKLVERAVGIGMTDSNRFAVPDQINSIASALANRVGERFGLPAGQGFQLSPQAAKPSAKPQAQAAPPTPQGLPQATTGGSSYDVPPPAASTPHQSASSRSTYDNRKLGGAGASRAHLRMRREDY